MREATQEENESLSRLHQTVVARGDKNALRSRFVEAEERLRETGFTIPTNMERLQVALNWPAKVVSAFAARQVPEFFSTRNPTSLLDDIEDVYTDNDFFAVERWAIEAADQHGCAFVFVTRGDTTVGEPEFVLSARTALTATAVLDPRSRRVVEALEWLGGTRVVLHLPGISLTCIRRTNGWWVEDEVTHGTSMVMCAPYVHGGSLEKPLGRSRVTNTVMDLTRAGARTLLRQEVSAEFFQAPRMMLMGTDQSVFTDSKTGREMSPFEVLTGSIWAIPDIDPNEAADAGMSPDNALRRADFKQLSQMSMQPFSDQYRLLASALSGAASIPLQYMGVVSDSNPTSAAAIEASEVDLIREVRAQNPSLGVGRRMLAMCILHAIHGDLVDEDRAEVRSLVARWEDPRTRSMSEQSQMTALQVQAGNLQAGTKTTLRQLPLSQEDVEAAVAENERAAGGSLLERVMAGGQAGESADEPKLSERANTFGILIRTGAQPVSAARVASGQIDISEVEMIPGAMPITIREGMAE